MFPFRDERGSLMGLRVRSVYLTEGAGSGDGKGDHRLLREPT